MNNELYIPKKDIYELLKELGVEVSQKQPEKFNTLPFINYKILKNEVETDLDNNILFQKIEVQIDIWSLKSVENSELLKKLEQKFRVKKYKMIFCGDVDNPGNIFHTVCRFKY